VGQFSSVGLFSSRRDSFQGAAGLIEAGVGQFSSRRDSFEGAAGLIQAGGGTVSERLRDIEGEGGWVVFQKKVCLVTLFDPGGGGLPNPTESTM
jgi:hypothetical protein